MLPTGKPSHLLAYKLLPNRESEESHNITVLKQILGWPMKKSLQLKVNPNLLDIQKEGGNISDFLKSHGLPEVTVQEQIMIIWELVKTAMKYGNFTQLEDRLTVQLHVGEREITVEVKHPVNDTSLNHLKKLDKTIQLLRKHQDPFEAYLGKLKEVCSQPHAGEPNDLGLTRIAYETQAILDYFVSDKNILNLSAVRGL